MHIRNCCQITVSENENLGKSDACLASSGMLCRPQAEEEVRGPAFDLPDGLAHSKSKEEIAVTPEKPSDKADYEDLLELFRHPEHHEKITLNAAQWAAFQEALNAPPQEHDRLKALLRSKPPWEGQ